MGDQDRTAAALFGGPPASSSSSFFASAPPAAAPTASSFFSQPPAPPPSGAPPATSGTAASLFGGPSSAPPSSANPNTSVASLFGGPPPAQTTTAASSVSAAPAAPAASFFDSFHAGASAATSLPATPNQAASLFAQPLQPAVSGVLATAGPQPAARDKPSDDLGDSRSSFDILTSEVDKVLTSAEEAIAVHKTSRAAVTTASASATRTAESEESFGFPDGQQQQHPPPPPTSAPPTQSAQSGAPPLAAALFGDSPSRKADSKKDEDAVAQLLMGGGAASPRKGPQRQQRRYPNAPPTTTTAAATTAAATTSAPPVNAAAGGQPPLLFNPAAVAPGKALGSSASTMPPTLPPVLPPVSAPVTTAATVLPPIPPPATTAASPEPSAPGTSSGEAASTNSDAAQAAAPKPVSPSVAAPEPSSAPPAAPPSTSAPSHSTSPPDSATPEAAGNSSIDNIVAFIEGSKTSAGGGEGTRLCSICKKQRPKRLFTKNQLKKREHARCRDCSGDSAGPGLLNQSSAIGAGGDQSHLTSEALAEQILRERTEALARKRAEEQRRIQKEWEEKTMAELQAREEAEQKANELAAKLAQMEREQAERKRAELEAKIKAMEEAAKQHAEAAAAAAAAAVSAIDPDTDRGTPLPAPDASFAVHPILRSLQGGEDGGMSFITSTPTGKAGRNFDESDTSFAFGGAADGRERAAVTPKQGQSDALGDPADWIEYFTDEGRKYYHNAKINDTRWDPPPGWVPPEVPHEMFVPEEIPCNACGFAVNPDFRFCGKCGAPTTGPDSVPTECQSTTCESVGADRRVVKCCYDPLCQETNGGRPFHLCRTCERTLHSHPALRNHDVQPVFTRLAEVVDDTRSVHSMAAHHDAIDRWDVTQASGVDTPRPPGPYNEDGTPDMSHAANRLWYERRGVIEGDYRFGLISEDILESLRPDDTYLEDNVSVRSHDSHISVSYRDETEEEPAVVEEPVRPRTPPPRFHHPIVSFGFGGKLLVMFPKLVRAPVVGEADAQPMVVADGEEAAVAATWPDQGAPEQTDADADAEAAEAEPGTDGSGEEGGAAGSDGDEEGDAGNDNGAASTGEDDGDTEAAEPVDMEDGGAEEPVPPQASDEVVDGLPQPIGVYSLADLLPTEDAEAMAHFPGPLGLDVGPPRSAVVAFAEERGRGDGPAALLWRLLAIICKHNGAISRGSTSQAENTDPVTTDIAKILADSGVGTEVVLESAQGVSADERAAAMAELQRHMACGSKYEALRVAIRAQIWDHAFVISQCIGRDAFSDVIARFAEAMQPSGHPLRQLYTLYAGRGPPPPPAQPPLYEDLTHWQATLATVLSNPTAGDTTMIRHLGDSLRAQGNVQAAHFCYLCVRETPACSPNLDCRMRLLGAEHKRARGNTTWITVEALQQTQVLEYARSLSVSDDSNALASSSFLPEFHTWKLWYAMRLAEMGETRAALAYCDALGRQLRTLFAERELLPPAFNGVFTTQLSQLAARLRANNPTAASQSTMGDFWATTMGQLVDLPAQTQEMSEFDAGQSIAERQSQAEQQHAEQSHSDAEGFGWPGDDGAEGTHAGYGQSSQSTAWGEQGAQGAQGSPAGPEDAHAAPPPAVPMFSQQPNSFFDQQPGLLPPAVPQPGPVEPVDSQPAPLEQQQRQMPSPAPVVEVPAAVAAAPAAEQWPAFGAPPPAVSEQGYDHEHEHDQEHDHEHEHEPPVQAVPTFSAASQAAWPMQQPFTQPQMADGGWGSVAPAAEAPRHSPPPAQTPPAVSEAPPPAVSEAPPPTGSAETSRAPLMDPSEFFNNPNAVSTRPAKRGQRPRRGMNAGAGQQASQQPIMAPMTAPLTSPFPAAPEPTSESTSAAPPPTETKTAETEPVASQPAPAAKLSKEEREERLRRELEEMEQKKLAEEEEKARLAEEEARGKADESSSGSGGGGLFSRLGGFISMPSFKRKNEMVLDSGEVKLEWDEEHKLWLPKDPKEREEAIKKANVGPPPPPPSGGGFQPEKRDEDVQSLRPTMPAMPAMPAPAGGAGPDEGLPTGGRINRARRSRPQQPRAAAPSGGAGGFELTDPLNFDATSAPRAGSRRRKPQYVSTGLSAGLAAPPVSGADFMPPPMPAMGGGAYAGKIMLPAPVAPTDAAPEDVSSDF